jgi:hypothetical protein
VSRAEKIEQRKALKEFVADVEAAGGVTLDPRGIYHPIGAPCWTDLAWTYLHACEALGKDPKVINVDDGPSA